MPKQYNIIIQTTSGPITFTDTEENMLSIKADVEKGRTLDLKFSGGGYIVPAGAVGYMRYEEEGEQG